jgi:hypothetical protein
MTPAGQQKLIAFYADVPDYLNAIKDAIRPPEESGNSARFSATIGERMAGK